MRKKGKKKRERGEREGKASETERREGKETERSRWGALRKCLLKACMDWGREG